MKTLIIYYSLTGNNSVLAKYLTKELKSQVERIETKRIQGQMGIALRSLFRFKTSIKPIKNDTSKYDLVILSYPVYLGTIAPAMRTYLSINKSKLKNIAIASASGGDANTKSITEIEALTGKKPIATLQISTAKMNPKDPVQAKITEKDLEKGDYAKKVKDFVDMLSSKKK
jgi:flavodoxin